MKSEFFEGYSYISGNEKGLLHCEVAAFRTWVEEQLILGKEWNCQKAFEFIERCLKISDPELKNALEISFIEDLALWQHEDKYRIIVKKRAPIMLRKKLIAIHEFWE